MFMSLKACVKAERMTLGPRSITSPEAMCKVFGSMPNLVAIDLSGITRVDDQVIKTLAQTCRGLQGLNLNGCRLVGDEAVCLLAANCKNLRRVSDSPFSLLCRLPLYTFFYQPEAVRPEDLLRL